MNVLFSLLFLVSGTAFAKTCLDDTSAALQKGQLFREQEQYVLALQQFSLVSSFACSDKDKALAQLASAQSLYKLGDNYAAELAIKDLASARGPVEIKNKGALLQGWYQPNTRQSLSPQEQQQFSTYENQAATIRMQHRLKNPWVSGVASAVIPGAGQVYNGNYQSAAFSFIVNSLFLATALELNRKDLPISAVAAGLIFSITYTGNILSSISAANTINNNAVQPLLLDERKKSIPGLEL